jgi:hypothetical protein
MSFCLLESDQKTFEYFKNYVEYLEKHSGSCFDLDNQIQAKEIKRHLVINGIASDNANEKIDWIRRNGKPFREYLNTIKLAYVVWKCSGKEWETIRWEDFINITKQINELKMVCLDTIF